MGADGVSDAVVKVISDQMNDEEISNMTDLQKQMLTRFEKTNEMLSNFNSLSSARYLDIEAQFKKHINLMNASKKDLEQIFKRIRQLKKRLTKQFPDEFTACTQVYEVPDDNDINNIRSADNRTSS